MRLHNDLKICKQVTIRGIELLYVIIVSVILAALMELNKNILPGFILLVIVDIAFGILRRRVIVGNGRLILLTGYAAFTFCAILVFFMTRPPVKLVPAYNGSKPEYSSVVETDKGKVQGVYARNGKVEIFAGIPYAKPPVSSFSTFLYENSRKSFICFPVTSITTGVLLNGNTEYAVPRVISPFST